MSSSNNNNTRMGDLFQQRRGFSGSSSPHSSGGNHPSSNRSSRGQPSRGRGRGRQSQQQNQYNDLPLEQGVVCSLKESFGFIHCADRPDEVFFHFSQLQGVHAIDIRIDDEVEFRIGTSQKDADKWAAFQVRRLEPGTIVWEKLEQEAVQGLIERPVPRGDRDGTIRVVEEESKEEEETSSKKLKDRMLVRFGTNDYNPNDNANHRLGRGDKVQFTMVKDRRTKEMFAKNMQLVQTEKEIAEARLLAEATEEHGVITALKGDYGFLRSNKRREEVYFHYSSISMRDETETGEEMEDDDNMVLKEGQDMKFFVVTEGNGEQGGARRRISARRVSLQPRGSVRFHDVLARGVSGKVILKPQPQDSGHALETQGKIRLDVPIRDIVPDEDGNELMVKEVYLHTKDSPGGSFPFRGGSSVGLWIELGDTLLFDVVKDFADGACRAVPTIFTERCPNPTDVFNNGGEVEEEDGEGRAVRLMELSLISRSDGTVNALKESYGFIHFSERPVDVHFKLFQLLPETLQCDLRRNMGLPDVDKRGNPLELSLNAEVQFDISVHGSIQSHQSQKRGARQANTNQERENLKAQRVLLLPPGTVRQNVQLATKMRGVVVKDSKQPYSGQVDFDEEVNPMSMDDRHPFVAKMIDNFLLSSDDNELVFHDILSSKEDEVVIKMIRSKAEGKLTWSYLPVPGEYNYPGRLRIRKKQASDGTLDDGFDEHKNIVSDDEGPTDDEAGMDTMSNDGSTDGMDMSSADGGEGKTKPVRKRKQKGLKPFKTLHFDKSNLSNEQKEDLPPGVDDIVEFDVVQSRRTGHSHIDGMKIVERRSKPAPVANPSLSSRLGVVKEVTKKFGFIAVIDDTAESLDPVFFNFSSVEGSKVKKGDEVQFEIKIEKSGKRVAKSIVVLPPGTLPNRADKDACSGLVLLEPTLSTLSNTPVRSITPPRQKAKAGSRWENVVEDLKQPSTAAPETEKGCILLVDDPTGMFAKVKGEDNDDATGTEAKSSSTIRHVRYHNGSIAVHGTGASMAEDEKSKPRRGDLVSFVKTKKGTSNVRDVRLIERGAATSIKGELRNIPSETGGSAMFVSSDGKEFSVMLSEIVSCDTAVLKEKEAVEGILHDGNIYGICRTVDLYLKTKLGMNNKERPKLNLTVKKDRGGKIMAQSMMAKGPDAGSDGFEPGWTKRMSAFVTPFVPSPGTASSD